MNETEAMLATSLTPSAVADWWNSKNRHLGGERPIDLLAENRYERVLEGARAFIDGTYF